MNARAKMPDGHFEKSLRSSPSQRSAPTFVTVTMVSMLIPRRSRSLRRRGPKVSLSDMRIIARSKDRAEQYAGRSFSVRDECTCVQLQFRNRLVRFDDAFRQCDLFALEAAGLR